VWWLRSFSRSTRRSRRRGWLLSASGSCCQDPITGPLAPAGGLSLSRGHSVNPVIALVVIAVTIRGIAPACPSKCDLTEGQGQRETRHTECDSVTHIDLLFELRTKDAPTPICFHAQNADQPAPNLIHQLRHEPRQGARGDCARGMPRFHAIVINYCMSYSDIALARSGGDDGRIHKLHRCFACANVWRS
jgi:hypothetical protein